MRRKYIPLITGLLLLLGAHVSLALTLSDMRTAIRRNVRDTATSTTLQRYTDAMITAIINEGQRDVVTNTWCITKATSVSVSADVSAALPTDVIQVYRVLYNSASLPEINFQQEDADSGYTSWTASTDTVPSYFIQDKTRTSGTTNIQMQLTVYPQPQAVATLKVFYYATAPDLSSDADLPFNSQSWLTLYDDLLVWYGTYRLLYIEGMADKANLFKSMYDTRLQVLYEDYGAKIQRVPAVPTKEQKP